ncbi:hypothetical protein GGX14DRAFT_534959 [Mycena pura]|uniref:Zn(2)-C6 fungal-type domain-containing protein n=1 Tax=Mycena pura TaxID=153505 RepID=A0AAD6VKI3_9AGAR|nr:hypothetical protein GGX14DRAFT_534959 [Mycena pura]
MDDSFQFIIESPQHAQGHKKRPRLVTSCDNCRLKKIKCLQPTPESKCEACKTAKIPCRFRDRERYFAERSRAIAGPNVGSPYGDEARLASHDHLSSSSSSSAGARSSTNSPKPSGVVVPEGDSRYLAYPPDARRSLDGREQGFSSPIRRASSSLRPSRNDSISYRIALCLSRPPGHEHGSRPVHLFDPERPQFPHPTYMAHFIQLFFEQLGAEFPFITYDEVSRDFWDQVLSPLLANCIAAMATRYSTLPDLTVRGLHNVAETYGDNAKTILASIAHIPSMDTLHGVMLLSWSEYKNNRIPGLRSYCQMAMKMAMDLGVSDQNVSPINASEGERNRRRSTWASILQLHLTASSCECTCCRVCRRLMSCGAVR